MLTKLIILAALTNHIVAAEQPEQKPVMSTRKKVLIGLGIAGTAATGIWIWGPALALPAIPKLALPKIASWSVSQKMSGLIFGTACGSASRGTQTPAPKDSIEEQSAKEMQQRVAHVKLLMLSRANTAATKNPATKPQGAPASEIAASPTTHVVEEPMCEQNWWERNQLALQRADYVMKSLHSAGSQFYYIRNPTAMDVIEKILADSVSRNQKACQKARNRKTQKEKELDEEKIKWQKFLNSAPTP